MYDVSTNKRLGQLEALLTALPFRRPCSTDLFCLCLAHAVVNVLTSGQFQEDMIPTVRLV
jgi:hypothetical protein